MSKLLKRVKAGAWIALAGFISTLLVLVVENIERFQLSEQGRVVVIILATAVVSQITKAINNWTANK